MATQGQFNTKSPTIKRILREATELSSSPSPDYHAHPLESNIFEWHFTLSGPPSPSPYDSGLYHGRIILPSTYPLRPPSFRFLTPTGRFEVNREICLSISGHHEETWQPAWGIRTALVALRSFMDQDAKGQIGGLDCTTSVRERLAKESRTWRCAACGGKTNDEVMREVAEIAQGDGEFASRDEEIPKELRMGYKDEMGPKTEKSETSSDTSNTSSNHTSVPPTPPTPVAPSVSSRPPPLPRAPLPPQHAPQVTRVIHVPPQQHRAISSNDGVPAWIDKAIGGVFACLIVMILKKVLEL
ncbi:MAG: hypothetical protein M4579_002946 [Chaenotheca gracillima]|nr:MAG: hypothetical protein M4579_002946 [Chaenotheca gracillima]